MKAKATIFNIQTALTQNNLIFPVPQSQIDINPTKIKQNAGY
jgi:starch-binding outer membrane protein, SusD/RagB family